MRGLLPSVAPPASLPELLGTAAVAVASARPSRCAARFSLQTATQCASSTAVLSTGTSISTAASTAPPPATQPQDQDALLGAPPSSPATPASLAWRSHHQTHWHWACCCREQPRPQEAPAAGSTQAAVQQDPRDAAWPASWQKAIKQARGVRRALFMLWRPAQPNCAPKLIVAEPTCISCSVLPRHSVQPKGTAFGR